MKEFTRTVITTTIKGVSVEFIEGEMKTKEISCTAYAELTKEEAQKELTKAYGSGAVVKDITTETALYVLPMETFLKYAKKAE